MSESTVALQGGDPYQLCLDGNEYVRLWGRRKSERLLLKNSAGELLIGESIEKMRAAIDLRGNVFIRWDECAEPVDHKK